MSFGNSLRRAFKALLSPRAAAIALIGSLVLPALPAAADPIVISRTGSPSNRVDLVILGDGYTSSEMATFRTDTSDFINHMFGQEPFKTYRPLFNITRLETASRQSGASSPGNKRDTVYGAEFKCFNVDRLVCIDEDKVKAKLDAEYGKDDHDIVIVLVNDSRYGGSGGQYAVATTHPLAGEIAVHEIGHSFADLDDEYVDAQNCGRYGEPNEVNVTEKTTRATIPWAYWIPSSTPIPTSGDRGPGLYEGAFFCATGTYRPTDNSKMRTLDQPLEEINSEVFIRTFYSLSDPIDRLLRKAGNVKMPKAGKLSFAVRPVAPNLPDLKIIWRLNGKRLAVGARSVKVTRKQLKGKTGTLTLTIRDSTPSVRRDPKRLLSSTVKWTIKP